MAENHMYTMSVDLAIIESLGINLYSNAAAVLSELVANAYDADATVVKITRKTDDNQDVIEVVDNGCGMDVNDINEKFLVTGYKKRQVEGKISNLWKRPFMGRKGIGKLSVFSIAQHVQVYSTKTGANSVGLEIRIEKLEERITAKKPYHPDPIEIPDEYRSEGTTIVLRSLKRKRADLTVAALRKRLARRFDVLDPTPEAEGGFKIYINDAQVTYADRQDLKKLEYIWEFGQPTLPDTALPDDIVKYVLDNQLPSPFGNDTVDGWFGTARVPSDLTQDEEAGSLKNIIVLARKRPIQEGIVEKLDFSRVFGNYVTGQIEADFLDQDEEDDIATSDRQRLIEDDPRVVALQHFLRNAFKAASDTWNRERPKRKAKEVLVRHPQLREWIERLPQWQQDSARRMIGVIESLPMEKRTEQEDRVSLYRAGILAFARIGLRETAEQLDSLSEVTAESLLALLGNQDDYEAALWVDILKSRIQAISQFRCLTRVDEKERVLQEHLFNHLWLLDVSWERATGSERMEEDLRNIDPESFPEDLEGKEILGRIDIRYASVSGMHVIVELKRYSVSPRIQDLEAQGRKYLAALKNVLSKRQEEYRGIEVVFVLGSHPRVTDLGAFDTDDQAIAHALRGIFGKYVLYDELIENACKQYEEYFAASSSGQELDELLASLEAGDDDD